MKRGQIILLVIFLVLTGLIYLALSSNKKSFSKQTKEENKTVFVPVRKVQNLIRSVEITSYGQISPTMEILISFEVQGKLKQGKKHLKPGMHFSQGELLYQVNNEEAYYQLVAKKTAFNNLIISILPDIQLDFPSELNKWESYAQNIDPSGIQLKGLPKINSTKEKMFLISRGIIAEFYNIRSSESRMEKYYFIAPFSGTVVETYAEPGAIVNPGSQIAKIAKTGSFEVKVPIDIEDLDLYKNKNSVTFTDANGTQIGSGKMLRISDVINQQTQSADVYYSISPLKEITVYNGMFLNAKIDIKEEKETMALPRNALTDNTAYLLNNGKITEQKILIVGSKPDTVFVTGLSNDATVILERVEEIDNTVTYEGITR